MLVHWNNFLFFIPIIIEQSSAKTDAQTNKKYKLRSAKKLLMLLACPSWQKKLS